MLRRIWLIVLTTLAALPFASGPVGAITTPCDSRPDTSVPGDAILSTRFLADVDGDGARDVITGYQLGNDPDLAEHWLHVQLASGWGTQVRIDAIPEFSDAPTSSPLRVVSMSGMSLIVTMTQFTLIGGQHAMFVLEDCALRPVLLAGGGYPDIFDGFGIMHREWFSCEEARVIMIEVFKGLDENGEPIEGIWAGGEARDFVLGPAGFDLPMPLDLGLPRTSEDLAAEFPECSSFGGTFTDDDLSTFQNAIEFLAFERITTGCNPPASDRFCPDGFVTRGQMAAFLVRALGYTDDGGGDLFIDDDGHVFEGAIDRLGTAGVTRGCNPPANDKFCPDRLVTRAEMAAFLVRAFGYTDPGAGDWFVDDDGVIYEDAIDRLRFAEVTLGCNPPSNDRYCPSDKVTRGQMAAFLRRAMD